MNDRFENFPATLESVATDAVAVQPDDGADLAELPRAIYVGADGDLAVAMASGGEVIFAGVAAGTILPIRVKRIKATGTSAGAIVALY